MRGRCYNFFKGDVFPLDIEPSPVLGSILFFEMKRGKSMKRIMGCLLILSCMCCLYCKAVAVPTEDSLHISEEALEILRSVGAYPVYRIYREDALVFFGKQTPISDLTTVCTNYLYKLEGGNSYKEIKDGKVLPTSSTEFRWCEWDQYVLNPELIFGAEIDVYNIYCFDDSDSLDPVCIYYVTNQGDYVLISEFMWTNDVHLFPANVFYQYMSEVYELQLSNRPGSGRYTILDIAGVEEYVLDMESKTHEEGQETVPPTEISNDVKPNEPNEPNTPEKAEFDWVRPVAWCVVAALTVVFAIPVIKRKKSQ